MRSISTLLAAALLAASPALAASATAKNVEEPSAAPTIGVAVVQGCFSSPGELHSIGTIDFNAKDICAVTNCKAQGFEVAASMGGNQCFCGHKYPPAAALVNDSFCDYGCTGYDLQACGGNFYYTVYNTGMALAVEQSDNSILSSSSSSSASKPTSAGTTVTEAATVTVDPSTKPAKSGGTNTAGIAAGVVVGVLAIAGIFGGIFLFMRRKRNKQLEEDHRRNQAISTFFPRPPGSSGGYSGPSMSDARLDPVLAARRVSNGSIADNQDYSRKILRVTNA